MNVAVVILGVTLAASVGLAVMARRGRDVDLEEWAVARRGFGGLFVFLLMAGEIYTTVTFLGVSGFAYGTGGPALYILAYGCLAYVLSYWLLPPVWRYAKRHRLFSSVDIFAHRYQSRTLGVVVALVAAAASIPYLAVQLKGLGLIVSATSGGEVSSNLAIWLGTVVLCVYVIASGIRGSAWTAALKDGLALIVVVFLGIYLPLHFFGGFSEMFHQVQNAKPGFLEMPDTGLTPLWFSSTVLLTVLGFYMWPHTMGAALTARNERVFRVNAAVLPIYNILLLFVLFVGFAAIIEVPGLQGPDGDLALLRLSDAAFPSWLVGVIGAAGLLTALVPGSILLITTATMLARNVFRAARPEATDGQVANLARYLVPVVALAALYFAFGKGETIINLLLLGYALVTQLFPALLAGILPNARVSSQAAIAGIVAGVATVTIVSLTTVTVSSGATLGSAFTWIPTPWAELNLGVIALAVNVVVMMVASLLTRGQLAPAVEEAVAKQA